MYRQLPPCPTLRYWRIRPGDTFFRITRFLNITVDEIIELNPGINPQNLEVGQLICIPRENPCPSGVFWTVSQGDTLFNIAQQTGTTVARLLELNPGIDPNNLQVGQSLCLPG